MTRVGSSGRSVSGILAGLLALAGLAWPGSGCRPQVILRCPPTRHSCSVKAHQPKTLTPPPRTQAALFGFLHPRTFGVPHRLERPRSVAIDPSGRHLAVGGAWGELLIIRTSDGKVRHRLGRLEELADGLRLAFTRDGQHLVSAGHGHNRIRLWKVATGQLVREQKVTGYSIQGLATGPGTLVAVATGKGAEIWDLTRGRRQHLARMRYDLPVVCVAGSKGALWAAGDRAGNVRLFSTSGRGGGGLLESPGKRLATLAISGDGQLVAAGFENGLVQLHDTADLASRRSFRFYTRSPPVQIRLTANAEGIMVAEESGKISHLDTEDGRLLASYGGGGSRVQTLDADLSATGTRVVVVSTDRRVTLWQGEPAAPALELPARFDPPLPPRPRPQLKLLQPARIVLNTQGLNVTSFTLGRRGQFLAVAGQPSRVSVYYLDYTPRHSATPVAKLLYRRASPPMTRKQARQPVWVAITPDRRWLLAHGSGFTLARWALISGRSIPGRQRELPTTRGLLPAHDNKTVIAVAGREVLGWALSGAKRFRFSGLAEAYWMGVSPSSRRLVMIRGWDRVAAYDLPSGTLRWGHDSGPLPDYEVLAVVLPEGSQRLMTYHQNGFLRTYDLDTGALRRRSRIPLPEATQRCAIRPDGRVLACAHPGGVALAELPSGAPLGTIPPPPPFKPGRLKVHDLQWSPKGNTLVIQTGRQQLAVYNFEHPGEVKRYTGIEAVARIRLGLPIVPPPVRHRPSALTGQPRLAPTGPLRKDPTTPGISPDPGSAPPAPAPAPAPRAPSPRR